MASPSLEGKGRLRPSRLFSNTCKIFPPRRMDSLDRHRSLSPGVSPFWWLFRALSVFLLRAPTLFHPSSSARPPTKHPLPSSFRCRDHASGGQRSVALRTCDPSAPSAPSASSVCRSASVRGVGRGRVPRDAPVPGERRKPRFPPSEGKRRDEISFKVRFLVI